MLSQAAVRRTARDRGWQRTNSMGFSSMKHPFRRLMDRRRVPWGRYAGGLGSDWPWPISLPRKMTSRRADGPSSGGAARRTPHHAAHGQVRHLPVPARRAEPNGPVRPKNRAYQAARQTASRQAGSSLPHATGKAPRVAVHVQQAAGQSGVEAVGASPAYGSDRRRDHARSVDENRVRRSRSAALPRDPLRQDASPADRRGGRGQLALTAWARSGSELLAYVVLSDPGGLPVDGPHNWSSGYLPAVYQGTAVPRLSIGTPVAHLAHRPMCRRARHGATSSTSSTASTRAHLRTHQRERRTRARGWHQQLR